MRGITCLLLALSLPLTAAAQVLVNECETGIDAVEIFNAGVTPVDVGGWRAEWGGYATTGVWNPGSFTFPLGTILPAGALCVLRENVTTPVTPGVLTFETANIYWVTTGPNTTVGGSLTLVDAANQGVDTVRWYGIVPPGGSFGASFSGLLSPAISAFGRGATADTDTAADWIDTPSSLGTLNQGQIPPPITAITLGVTTNGAGSLQWSVATAHPAVPGGQIFNFVSLEDHEPDGSGYFFGVGFDALFQLNAPLDPSGIFHTVLDGSGAWSLSLPAGVPPGLHAEFVSILVGPTSVERISGVSALTF